MKKIILIAIIAGLFTACRNDDKNNRHGHHKNNEPKTQADSLMAEVLAGHDAAMPKSMKIPDIEKKVQALLDSIDKLPAKAKEAATPLKAKLEGLAADLSYATTAMDKWMEEFNYDSASNNLEQRIKYLTEEKLKVEKVKEAVLGSLAKADSLLKEKF
jgi:hypothetical protein